MMVYEGWIFLFFDCNIAEMNIVMNVLLKHDRYVSIFRGNMLYFLWLYINVVFFFLKICFALKLFVTL